MLAFAHGTNVSPEGYLPLLTTLAEAGYVVVAPHTAPIGWCEQQYLDQQRVAEIAADEKLWTAGTEWLWSAIDASKIGAVGHSMGGFSTAVNAATNFFRAAVSYAPYYDGFSNEAPLATTPIFYVSGSLDPIVVPQETINYYYGTDDNVPKVGAVVEGYDHLTMVADALFAETYVVAFFDCFLREEGTYGSSGCATIRDTLCTSPEYFPMYFCAYDQLLLLRNNATVEELRK